MISNHPELGSLLAESENLAGFKAIEESTAKHNIVRHFVEVQQGGRNLTPDQMWQMVCDLRAEYLWHGDQQSFIRAVKTQEYYTRLNWYYETLDGSEMPSLYYDSD